jgi:hypothetical protein
MAMRTADPRAVKPAPGSYRIRPLAGLLMVLALTTGCAGSAWFRNPAPAEDVDFARRYLALFQSRSWPAIEMAMDPSLKDPQMRTKVMQMASLFPPAEPLSAPLIAWNVKRSDKTITSSLSFEYEFPGRWVLANVVVERSGQASVVKSVQINALRESLATVNRVSLTGKGAAHYAAAAACIAVLLFVMFTFILAVRTPAPSMKWAWAAFVLVGVVRFAFNWTAGTLTIVPMAMQFLGSGFTKPSPFEPLVLTTSIPVGAIVYLIQRHEWLQDMRASEGAFSPAGPNESAE